MSENSIKLPHEIAVALTCGDETDGWYILEDEVIDQWRWGNVSRVVVMHPEVLGVWAYEYKTQSGDHWYSSVDDEGAEVTFYRVVPRAKTVIEYVLPGEGE